MQRPWGRNRLEELRTAKRPVWLQHEMGPERQKGPITWGSAGLGKTSFNSVASMQVHGAPEASFTDGMEQIHSGFLDLSVGRSIRSDWGRSQETSRELRNHLGTEVTEAWIERALRLTIWGRETPTYQIFQGSWVGFSALSPQGLASVGRQKNFL